MGKPRGAINLSHIINVSYKDNVLQFTTPHKKGTRTWEIQFDSLAHSQEFCKKLVNAGFAQFTDYAGYAPMHDYFVPLSERQEREDSPSDPPTPRKQSLSES